MIQPQRDLVFISQKRPETQTAAGIVIPEMSQSGNDRGIVVACGSGKAYSNGEIIPLTVKVGDEVIFNKHAGQTARLDDGEEVLVMREDDIFIILGEAA